MLRIEWVGQTQTTVIQQSKKYRTRYNPRRATRAQEAAYDIRNCIYFFEQTQREAEGKWNCEILLHYLTYSAYMWFRTVVTIDEASDSLQYYE